MKAAVVEKAKAPIVIEERERPEPGPGEVLIQVEACGICHGDLDVQQGAFPYTDITAYPIVPGHEVAGVVEKVGTGVDWPEKGMKVGMPWLYSSCGHCPACLAGDEVLCAGIDITGVTKDGGFQEYMVAPARHVSALPEGLDFAVAAPLMCAGLTVFTGLRHAGFEPGQKVAITGLGGLGHLGALYARAMGGRVAVISSSPDKEARAKELGAELFINSKKDDVTAALQAWDGGADVILATAPSADIMKACFPGLGRHGTLVVLGVTDDELNFAPTDFILAERRVIGSLIGSRTDIQDALAFAVAHGIKPEITTFALEQAGDAIGQMQAGTLRGRGVVVMNGG
jgi:D-arabinose 1-dehydrogenase-like Zn-dependent alcohol dehydrogenase